MISKDKLKKYANDLMFNMNEEEYETLANEFDTIIKQLDLIAKIDNISNVKPMTFPYINDEVTLRDDSVSRIEDIDEVLSNCHDRKGDDVRVPRVVE